MPRTWQTWRLLLLSRTLVRSVVVAAVVGAAIVIGIKLAMPLVQLPPLWRMLLVLPAFYGYAVVMFAVHAAIPSRIEIREDRIHVMTGQSHWVVKSGDIRRTRIVVFATDRIRLRVFYFRKGRMWSRAFGVGRRVDLEKLSAVLPVAPEVWDAQSRYNRGGADVSINHEGHESGRIDDRQLAADSTLNVSDFIR